MLIYWHSLLTQMALRLATNISLRATGHSNTLHPGQFPHSLAQSSPQCMQPCSRPCLLSRTSDSNLHFLHMMTFRSLLNSWTCLGELAGAAPCSLWTTLTVPEAHLLLPLWRLIQPASNTRHFVCPARHSWWACRIPPRSDPCPHPAFCDGYLWGSLARIVFTK